MSDECQLIFDHVQFALIFRYFRALANGETPPVKERKRRGES